MSRLKRHISAITGRFVRPSTARRHPDKTVSVPVERPRVGLELRHDVLIAAAEAVLEAPEAVIPAGIAADLISKNLAAVNLRDLKRLAAVVEAEGVPRPTDPCPCGSGKLTRDCEGDGG